MPPTVVCGIDETDGAGLVLRLGRELRDVLGVELVVTHVAADPPVRLRGDDPCRSGVYRVDLAQRTVEPEVVLPGRAVTLEQLGDARYRVEHGSPVTELRRVALEERARLLVVGARARGAFPTAVLGSVSLALAAQAPCPVVVLPPQASVPTGPDAFATIVAGVDAGHAARRALRLSTSLAAELGGRLVVAHVAPEPRAPGTSADPRATERLRHVELERGRELLRHSLAAAGLPASTPLRIGFGNVGGALADIAFEERAGLVVVGSHGYGVLRSALLGSVSRDLVRSSHTPVVLVPPDGGERGGDADADLRLASEADAPAEVGPHEPERTGT